MSSSWSPRHDLMYLMLSVGVADGRFSPSAQRALKSQLDEFFPKAAPRKLLSLSKAARERMQSAANGVAFLKQFQESAKRLHAGNPDRPERRARILKALRAIAYAEGTDMVDGKALLLLRSAVGQLEMNKAVRFKAGEDGFVMQIKKVA
ncbi:MAG: TerB family tellurite resistance protein [Myxococcota bacterium]